MEPEQKVEEDVMTAFELCRELNLKGFPQSRRDDAWYYVRPDMLIMMQDNNSLYSEDGKNLYNFFETAIYRPTESDFIEYLGSDFQQVIQTVRSGFFAYANSTMGEGVTTRSGGKTPWLALANLVYARLCEKDMTFIPTNSESTGEVTAPSV